MRDFLMTVPFLIAVSTSATWAQSPKPKGMDALAGIRAHLHQLQAQPAGRKIALDLKAADLKPDHWRSDASNFVPVPVLWSPQRAQ